jgi:hypothetical protein
MQAPSQRVQKATRGEGRQLRDDRSRRNQRKAHPHKEDEAPRPDSDHGTVSFPSRTQTWSPTVTVASVKRFQRT